MVAERIELMVAETVQLLALVQDTKGKEGKKGH